MRILVGEGGAHAPSSGQDGASGSGRRSTRFRPVRHFPSHSLQSTAVKSPCPDLTGPSPALAYPEFPGGCRSRAASATPSRQHVARLGARAHRGAHRSAAVRPRSGRGCRGCRRTANRLLRRPRRGTAIFGQLLKPAEALDFLSANTSATCGSTMRDDSEGGFRDPCDERRTSQRALGMKRFVIERFTPRYLVDLASDGELVTNAPPDTVDLIMGGLAGERAGPRGRRVDSRGA
jgi:hypothetical protein